MEIALTRRRIAILVLLIASLIAISMVTPSVERSNIKSESRKIFLYSQGFAIVEEARDLSLRKGLNSVELDIPAEAGRIHVLTERSRVISLISRDEPERAEVRLDNGEIISGKLLSAGMDFVILEVRNETLYIPRERVIEIEEKKGARKFLLELESESSGTERVRIRYRLDGISCRIIYRLMMGEGEIARIQAYPVVENGGSLNLSGSFYLVSGEIFQYGYGAPPTITRAEVVKAAISQPIEAESARIYPLGDLEIGAGETKSFPYLDEEIGVRRLYEIRIFASPWMDRVEGYPREIVEFRTDKPLPSGIVEVYSILDGEQVLIGESAVERTGRNDTIGIPLSEERDLSYTAYVERSERISERVVEYEVVVRIENRGTRDRRIKLSMGYQGELLEISEKPELSIRGLVELELDVPAGGTREIRARLRT